MLLKHYTDSEISLGLLGLIDNYLAAETADRMNAAQDNLWDAMDEDEIGGLTVDGLILTRASVWHSGTLGLIVATRDWKMGHAYVEGRRMKVHHKRYGNFWLTEPEMKRRQVTQEWLDEPAPESTGRREESND